MAPLQGRDRSFTQNVFLTSGMHWGACGRVGNAFPRPPGAKKKSGQVSVTKRRRVEVSALRRGVAVEVFYLMALIFMADDLLERAARRRATTASSLQLHAVPHRHPLMHRSGSARGRHGLGVPSLATPQPACCFRSIRSGLQQVRFLRKLMPGHGFYMDVLCYLLKAWKRCAVPAAIASC